MSSENVLMTAHPTAVGGIHCALPIASVHAAMSFSSMRTRSSKRASRSPHSRVSTKYCCRESNVPRHNPSGPALFDSLRSRAINSSIISHAIRLEQALVKLQTEQRIVVLHYSPIRATLQGEDPEIFAFLGSSRVEEPINRFRATAVFHGHAHNGIVEGKTATGIPVYNVSAPALSKTGKPYRIVEL